MSYGVRQCCAVCDNALRLATVSYGVRQCVLKAIGQCEREATCGLTAIGRTARQVTTAATLYAAGAVLGLADATDEASDNSDLLAGGEMCQAAYKGNTQASDPQPSQ